VSGEGIQVLPLFQGVYLSLVPYLYSIYADHALILFSGCRAYERVIDLESIFFVAKDQTSI